TPARLSLPAPASPPAPQASPTPSDPLAMACAIPSAQPSGAAPAGLWLVASGSQAGYRVSEKWAQLPSPHEAVARTDRVSGWLSISGTAGALDLQAGCFGLDLTALKSIDSLPGFRVADRDDNVQDFLDTA